MLSFLVQPHIFRFFRKLKGLLGKLHDKIEGQFLAHFQKKPWAVSGWKSQNRTVTNLFNWTHHFIQLFLGFQKILFLTNLEDPNESYGCSKANNEAWLHACVCMCVCVSGGEEGAIIFRQLINKNFLIPITFFVCLSSSFVRWPSLKWVCMVTIQSTSHSISPIFQLSDFGIRSISRGSRAMVTYSVPVCVWAVCEGVRVVRDVSVVWGET